MGSRCNFNSYMTPAGDPVILSRQPPAPEHIGKGNRQGLASVGYSATEALKAFTCLTLTLHFRTVSRMCRSVIILVFL